MCANFKKTSSRLTSTFSLDMNNDREMLEKMSVEAIVMIRYVP